MSVLGDAVAALREALKLTEDVKRIGATMKEVSIELREHDRRLTRLEAKWEAVVEMAALRGGAPGRLEN